MEGPVAVTLTSVRRVTPAGGGGGQMKRLYSAVPGRIYVATRAHSASGERQLSLKKGDKVKGWDELNSQNRKMLHLQQDR